MLGWVRECVTSCCCCCWVRDIKALSSTAEKKVMKLAVATMVATQVDVVLVQSTSVSFKAPCIRILRAFSLLCALHTSTRAALTRTMHACVAARACDQPCSCSLHLHVSSCSCD